MTSAGLVEHIRREYRPNLYPRLTLSCFIELHLRRYHQERLTYFTTYKDRLEHGAHTVVPTLGLPLRHFSKPSDIGGYCDVSITDDMITDIYLKFSRGTRAEESNEHLRTLTGTCAADLLALAPWNRLTCVFWICGSHNNFHRSDISCSGEGEDGEFIEQAREEVGRRNSECAERAWANNRMGASFAGVYTATRRWWLTSLPAQLSTSPTAILPDANQRGDSRASTRHQETSRSAQIPGTGDRRRRQLLPCPKGYTEHLPQYAYRPGCMAYAHEVCFCTHAKEISFDFWTPDTTSSSWEAQATMRDPRSPTTS